MNGNLTSDGTRSFEWDAENRLVAVVKGTHRSEFGYDGFGHRVEIREFDADANGNWVSSTDTKYVWEGAEIIESRTADGGTSLQRYYAQGFMDSDGTALYYTRDHLGSTRELVDAFGAIRARYDYDPYGRMTKISGDKDSPFLYTGHLWHPQSGLYFAPYREYDPNLGRWINRDPLSNPTIWLTPAVDGIFTGKQVGPIMDHFEPELLPEGPNIYTYVGNNPINSSDRFGFQAFDSCSNAIMNCMKLPTAAMRIDCLETLLDSYEGGGEKDLTKIRNLLDQQKRLLRTAQDVLLKEIKGSAQREFPSEFRDDTLEQIQKAAQSGDRAAKTAWKLLNDLRFRR